MGIYWPDDERAVVRNLESNEFSHPDADVIQVVEGCSAVGILSSKFISFGFSTCTPLILLNESLGISGFMHIYANQQISNFDSVNLDKLKGSVARPIEGLDSSNQRAIFKVLKNEYQIKFISPISIDILNSEKVTMPYHVAWIPNKKRVLISRMSHNDVLNFRAF